MGWFARMFSARGRAEAQYKQGLEKAKNKDLEGAIADYSAVISSKKTPADIKAMALFNRSLAYGMLGQSDSAENDLSAVVALPQAPASVVAAAKEKQGRLKKRSGRGSVG
jgi:lipoprotein NlpI